MSILKTVTAIEKTDETPLDAKNVLVEYGFKYVPKQTVSADGRSYSAINELMFFVHYRVGDEFQPKEILSPVDGKNISNESLELIALELIGTEHGISEVAIEKP
jgi:hypothetical protein